MKMVLKTLIAMGCLAACSIANAQTTTGYHLVTSFKLTGEGGWDYITASRDNLYVAHKNQVNVIDKATGKETGTIGNLEGVHGIAIVPHFKKGFITNGRNNTVTVFDLETNEVLATIKAGENPDAIIYDHFSRKVFVCNGGSRDLTIINPANNHVEKTLDLGGQPEMPVSNDDGLIYINLEDKNQVVAVNANTWFVENRWKIGRGKSPAGLAMDKTTQRLFIGCANSLLVVLNAENGHVINELPIGRGCDGVAFDKKMNYVFASCGDGTLAIIKEKSPAQFAIEETVYTQKGARTLALDETTHKVYLPTAELAPSSSQESHGRPSPVAGTFQVLVVGQ